MIEREITLNVEREHLVPSHRLAGFAGEHLATKLYFNIPEDWAVNSNIKYYVSYQTADGGRYRTTQLEWPVETVLPQSLMKAARSAERSRNRGE